MKIAITLGMLHPSAFESVAIEADRLGFESLWFPEHLIFPIDMAGSPFPGADHPPVPPETPLYDSFGMLCYLAAKTNSIRLGTNVYLLGLRHPFVAARAIQTLDLLSQGRAEIGVGAGWLRNEWTVTGLDPRTRGKRLDEAIEVCKRLWTQETIEFRGEFFAFESVKFEPKPIQKPHPPIHVGGESDAALRRAARVGDGWLGLHHNLESVREPIARLERYREEYGTADRPFEIIVGGEVTSRDDVKRWQEAGVTRLFGRPWTRSREAVEGLRRYADLIFD
ncbi:MAG: LLM class F420-dependent oxidoreductase [bacterium]|nr:LLM class F420-dependent oxidoreductase [Deltaproteobacteria bacterium]MCP4903827.1 LLM class F420-dependent oxidoreductase [bacterium]